MDQSNCSQLVKGAHTKKTNEGNKYMKAVSSSNFSQDTNGSDDIFIGKVVHNDEEAYASYQEHGYQIGFSTKKREGKKIVLS